MSTIVQEIVNRPGWRGRLGLATDYTGTAGDFWWTTQDYTNSAADAADLSVTYQTQTGYSFQRKVFYDSVNGRYWSFWYDGDSIEGWYSANDGTSWNAGTNADIAVDTMDFSLWHIPGDTYVYIAYVSNFDIIVRRGTLSATDITWGMAYTALNGASATDDYRRPSIARDGSGFLHVVAKYTTASNYYMRAARCGTADDPACIWTAADLSSTTNTDTNVYGTVVPLGAAGRTQDMYAVWTAGTAVQGARWDNDDTSGRWENTSNTAVPAGAADAVATGATASKNNMSAVVDSNFDVHLIYINATNDVAYRMFDESVPSWGGETTVATGTFEYPTLSRDSTTGYLYAIYMDNSDNSVDYAQYTTAWQTPTANWNTTTTGNFVTSNYQAPGRIFAHWSESIAGDYSNVDWAYIIVPESLWAFVVISPPSTLYIQEEKEEEGEKMRTAEKRRTALAPFAGVRFAGFKRVSGTLFVVLVFILMALPLSTTFNEVLTKVVEKTGAYYFLMKNVVPFETRAVSVILAPLGIKALASSSYLFVNKEGVRAVAIFFSWNCLGWQSAVLLVLTLFVGLAGRHSVGQKMETLVLGISGTFLINLVRISVVALVAYYFGQLPATLVHDYGGSLFTIIWFFFFWWFSYRYILMEEEVDTDQS